MNKIWTLGLVVIVIVGVVALAIAVAPIISASADGLQQACSAVDSVISACK